MEEDAYDLFFHEGFPGWDGTDEDFEAAKSDLQNVLDEWMKRHKKIIPTTTTFGDQRNAESIAIREIDD